MKEKRKILVTSALPYANGDIHLGHLLEYLQTDFWVRFQKMRGHECRYMCADDTHGSPVMISARNKGISPEELISFYHQRHIRDFKDFEIEFDNYYTTHSRENKELAEEIYLKMVENGHVVEKKIKQLYCERDGLFLPDRFVTGRCPSCGAGNQYGDSCDACSSTYSPSDLIDPCCALCGSKPVERESEHLFFRLNNFRDFLREWVRGHTSKEIANKLDEWLKEELRDWDISRDEPYFGFEIPGKKGKYFYVWVDAPIGYIASTKNWCQRNARDYREFWKNEDSELYHFIGKDIIYFHILFWPAMLKNAGYKTPDEVFVHGFLTINNEKMSKSKGTFIKARTYLNFLEPSYLRYYYASKMTPSIEDVDLNFEDFILRVNAELIGKITNLASRSVQMLRKIQPGIGRIDNDGYEQIRKVQEKAEKVASLYEGRYFSRVVTEVRKIAEEANKYIDEREPWKIAKEEPQKAIAVLGATINVFRLISIYLKPILPSYTQKVENLLKEEPYHWNSIDKILEDHELNEYQHLATRISMDSIRKILDEARGK